jgi:hypothetical protein
MILLQGGPPGWPPGNGGGAPPPPPNFPGPCTDGMCISIDQGILIVMIVGLVIGLYHLIKARKKRREQW